MPGFLIGDLDPVVSEATWQVCISEPDNDVTCEIDRVELDMGKCVQ